MEIEYLFDKSTGIEDSPCIALKAVDRNAVMSPRLTPISDATMSDASSLTYDYDNDEMFKLLTTKDQLR
jgi:hypothetical protein